VYTYVTILIAKTTLYDEEWTVDTKSLFFGKLRRALQYLSTKGAKCSARIGKYLMFTYSTAVKKPDTQLSMARASFLSFSIGSVLIYCSFVFEKKIESNFDGLFRSIIVIPNFFLYVNSSNAASTGLRIVVGNLVGTAGWILLF
jgi:hypothetical protein